MYMAPEQARGDTDAIDERTDVFALGAIVGPSVGPTVGGWLTDNVSWNYVFFINIAPGIFAAIIILTMMRNPTDPKPIPIDGLGLALLATGLGSLQYVLDEGQPQIDGGMFAITVV